MTDATGKFVFVVNPRSANGATIRRFERVRARFASELGDIDVRLTERPRHAGELAKDAIRAGAKAVISVGGDGTNNEVINGFFDAATSTPTPGPDGNPGATAFGVVTSGTGGDFRRTFAWTTEPLDDLARLKRFQTRRIDVGRVTFGDGTARAFVNIASFGMSGEVVDVVNNSSKALGAKLSFMLGSVRTMLGHKPQGVTVTVDDGETWSDKVTLVAIANGQYFGGGMWIAPEAKVDDAVFDTVAVAGGGLSFWLTHGLKLYSGKHIGLRQVKVQRAKKVRAEPLNGERVLVEIDGEQPGILPATFEIIPAAVSILV